MKEYAEPSRTRRRPNSAAPTQKPRLLLLLSLSLNLALILFLASVFRKSAPVAAIPVSDSESEASVHIPKKNAKRVAASPWQQLESSDLAVYAANLRAAGCPPETVRDILLPLIEEKFEHSELPASEPTNFWASFSQRQTAATARAEQEMVLEQKKDQKLKQLLGFAWTSEGLKHAHTGDVTGSVGFLDYEHAEKLLCVDDRLKKQFVRSHRIDRRSAIYEAWRHEVGEVLSPAEFEETELRKILMICESHNPNLCKVGLSGSELRQLMAFRREVCNPLPAAWFARDDEPLVESDEGGEKQFRAKARSMLGDSRFVDYLKGCDLGIERTLATLEREQLPRNLALQLFDLHQEAVARAQAIRQMPLSRAEKRAQLAALRQNALEQLASLPNAATDINRDWLQEIANP